MAMILYGFTPADVYQDPLGNIEPGTIAMIYPSVIAASPFTNTFAVVPPLTPGAGTGGQVTADALGRFAWFVENRTDPLWLDIGGVRWPVNPAFTKEIVQAETGEAIAEMQAQLTAMMAEAQADIDAATAIANEAKAIAQQVELAVNVKTEGAVGNGIADDTAAFVAVAAAGRIGYVPNGTYKITAASTDLPDGRFFGEGQLVFTGAGMDGEIQRLDRWVPQPINSQMIGDGHRNIVILGQGAALNAGDESGANVAVGTNALQNPSKSQRNTAIGSGAGKMLGDYDRAGVTEPNGNARRNVWVGTDAGMYSVWADRNTYVGSNAGKWAGDPDPLAHQHDFFEGNPAYSLAGIDAADRWPTVRADLVGPADAPAQVAVNENDNADNVGLGRNSLLHAVKSSQCVAAGTNALAHGFLVRSSTAIGDGALRDGLKASFNTALGASALLQMASGNYNVAVGNNALRLATHTDGHVAIGYGALENFTGGVTAPTSSTNRRNIAIGYGAASDRISGTEGIAIGPYAKITNYNQAIAIGPAAEAVTNGTALGHTAKANGASSVALGINALTTHTSSVAIGPNATTTANNQIQLGASGSNVVAAGAITAGGFVRCATYATASRPSASTAGAGAMIYDSTLGKPLWSNGSAWRDAAGTAV